MQLARRRDCHGDGCDVRYGSVELGCGFRGGRVINTSVSWLAASLGLRC